MTPLKRDQLPPVPDGTVIDGANPDHWALYETSTDSLFAPRHLPALRELVAWLETANGLAPQAEGERDAKPECTGISASWCPNHGDCTCERGIDGDCDFGAPMCPLHGDFSTHCIIASLPAASSAEAVAPPATTAREKCVDHEFADTPFCVKCGWAPPPDYGESLQLIDQLRRRADRAIALLRNCCEDPVAGIELARIYLNELDPNYVKPTF